MYSFNIFLYLTVSNFMKKSGAVPYGSTYLSFMHFNNNS